MSGHWKIIQHNMPELLGERTRFEQSVLCCFQLGISLVFFLFSCLVLKHKKEPGMIPFGKALTFLNFKTRVLTVCRHFRSIMP